MTCVREMLENLNLLEERFEAVGTHDGGGPACGANEALPLELAECADCGFVGRASNLRQLLAGQRDGGTELLREREEDLGEPGFGGLVDHATSVLDLPQSVAEEA